ncbi:hypothetical protein [Commensalibacter nepenthis]|uniref:Lipoprotein n=1 Tax=Commensalibacter nepenthis TaxID=3043872 RepID=A0ABT6Q4F7_9PROT|nr:hypothetical protein [Commensalibacter sp. TBRC 10068]MDI2111762.1 hypothetical protein [Commensalibacter sp. TBRC 10068]
MKLHTLLPILSLCMGLTACGPDVFYIPIDNKLGSAKPLSKTEDTIRVIGSCRKFNYVF